MDEGDLCQKLNRENYLDTMATHIEKLNHRLASFYRITKKEITATEKRNFDKAPVTEMSCCIYCGNPLKSGNYSMKLIPRRPFTTHVRRLMQKHIENPGSLGQYQRKLLNEFKCSKNKMKMTCYTCKKSWSINGQSSSERLKQKRLCKPVKSLEEKRTRKEKKKEKLKALGEKKQLRLPNEEVNAGLNISRDRRHMNQNNTTLSSVGSRVSLGEKETDRVKQGKRNVTKQPGKQKTGSQRELLEKVKDIRPELKFVDKSFKERKKQRFVSKLSGMLKDEKKHEKDMKKKDDMAKARSEKGAETSVKTGLQAFLSSL